MRILYKVFVALWITTICNATFAQSENFLEKRMLGNCRALAKELNKSHGVGIALENISPLVTWRAACAEKPPTGPGHVTALCQGERINGKKQRWDILLAKVAR